MSTWRREQAAVVHELQRTRLALVRAGNAVQVGRSVGVQLEDAVSDLLATVSLYEQALKGQETEHAGAHAAGT